MAKKQKNGFGGSYGKLRLGMVGMAVVMMLSASGCQQRKYEKIQIPSGISTAQVGSEGMVDETELTPDIPLTQASGLTAAAGTGEAADPVLVEMESRDETVYVDAENLNLRKAPDMNGQVLTRLSSGTQLQRIGFSQEWSQVRHQGQEGYVATRYLTMEKPQASEQTEGENADGGNGELSSADSVQIGLNGEWKYAEFAKITSGKAVLYRAEGDNRREKVICVNAGHGTKGGSSVKTQCHPDGTPKVTGGTTQAGAVSAVAVSSGMQFADGTAEAKVTLAMAKVLKEKLLQRGYDVLMIRETDDVQLDNVARTVIANNKADCHIALHWDSTSSDKGAFYMSVPEVASYRSMEPVASNWQKHHGLGDSLIAGLKGVGVKIFSNGKMAMDLTQTSYSTIPSVDIELGDKASDHSAASLDKLGNGLADGIDLYFGVS